METIIFIGTYKGGSSREGMKRAKSLGYYTVLITDRRRYLTQKNDFPELDEIIIEDLDEIQKLRVQIYKLRLTGINILAIISLIDPYVSTAVQLGKEFCNSDISLDAVKKMEDKIETRKALVGTPYNINFLTSSIENDFQNTLVESGINFPAVVKFPNSCGSRHVFLIESPKKYRKFIKKAKKEYSNKSLLIEEYMDGEQYLVEVIVNKGQVYPVVIIKQDISCEERFIVTGYSIISNLYKSFYQDLVDSVEKILKTIGMVNGTCHLELRLQDKQWKLIEINPRVSGGAMNQMVKAAYNIDLVGETIKFYLGHSICLEKSKEHNVYTYYITSKATGVIKKITGRYKARRMPGVVEVKMNFRRGNKVQPPLSMGHRLGYIIATGETIEEAKKCAKKAAQMITVQLEIPDEEPESNSSVSSSSKNSSNSSSNNESNSHESDSFESNESTLSKE